MILTYKVKHNRDFKRELVLARKVAEFALTTTSWSSAQVKHIGLKSTIACQILKKYSRNKTIKEVHNVNLAIPSQGIKRNGNNLHISCLKLDIPITFPSNFTKVNQIEVSEEYAHISVSFNEPEKYVSQTVFGVDRNSKHHVIVASNINTGKVLKLGKSCAYVHDKYKHIRKNLQSKGKLGLLKKIKHRESNIVRNTNHHISKKLVLTAKVDNAIIVLEDLKNIRTTAKTGRKQRYSLNSWSFHQLAQMVEYKAKKYGVSIASVAPQYTSQRCSRCGHIEASNRKQNLFQCKKCGRVEDAGVNAGFNIAFLHQQGIPRFSKDSDLLKGSTDTPKGATLCNP
jgi:putative transposase